MLKAAIKLTLLIALGITAYAQKSSDPKPNLKPKNYWGISFIPTLTTKTEIDGVKETYDLHIHPKYGSEILIHYHYTLRNNYALIFGLGVNSFGYIFHCKIPKNMFDPPTESDVSSDKYVSLGLPAEHWKVQAELLRRWPRNNVHNWNLAAGMSLLFNFLDGSGSSSGYVVDYPNGGIKRYLTFYHEFNNKGRPWFNFHISGGHEWILKSKNIFQANLKLNYSPINPTTGTYQFATGVQPDLSGTYGVSGSYIGLSLGYIFTRTKKV